MPYAGERPSFEDLAARYASEVPARILLDEWIRVGAALETTDGYVRLLNRTYLPSPLDPAGLERLGNVVNYFIDTVDFNLQKKRQGEGRFERYAITMEGISPRDFRAFHALIREKGQELLEILDDWLGQHEINGRASIVLGRSDQDRHWHLPLYREARRTKAGERVVIVFRSTRD